MNYKIFSPSDDLKKIVKYFIVIESLENIGSLLFLPNGGNFIVFNRGMKACSKSFCNSEIFEIPVSYSVSMKSNKVKSIVVDKNYEHKDNMFPIILVELLPIGFHKLFNIDASKLNSSYIEINEDTVSKHFPQLYKHNNLEEELAYLNKSLMDMNNSHCNKHLCLEDVLERINDEFFDISVQDLLDEFKCSRSTMERQFKKIVGFTPKRYILIAKFCKTFLEYVEGKRTFHELQYIYSDNSHMNLTFKNMLGIAPSEILARVKSEELSVYQINNLKALAS